MRDRFWLACSLFLQYQIIQDEGKELDKHTREVALTKSKDRASVDTLFLVLLCV